MTNRLSTQFCRPQLICNHMKINKTLIIHNIHEHAILEALIFWILIANNFVGIFHWLNPSGRTMTLDSDRRLTEMRKSKGKGHPRTGHDGPEGKQMYSLYSSTLPSTSALDEGGWSTSRPGRLTPGERPGTHCIGGWVGPRADMDEERKILTSPGFDPQTVQSIASRYTDCTIPAQKKWELGVSLAG
jgi:hypothetical protein